MCPLILQDQQADSQHQTLYSMFNLLLVHISLAAAMQQAQCC
jgi:hypothetical protein